MCWKCCHKMMQPKLDEEFGCSELVGCTELTKQEWEKGYYADEGETVFQHNCPLQTEMNKEQQ